MRLVAIAFLFAATAAGADDGTRDLTGAGKGGVVVLCNVATGKVDEVGLTLLERLAGEK